MMETEIVMKKKKTLESQRRSPTPMVTMTKMEMTTMSLRFWTTKMMRKWMIEG